MRRGIRVAVSELCGPRHELEVILRLGEDQEASHAVVACASIAVIVERT